ncbi:Predicted phosphoribosyltransferase [Streptomyces sp. 1222.5]|uniref:phosphoribosyltransferase n=1 Tax=unclassified Streptomyces TaxID=2593676 RepID=UPI00089A1FC8|nr:MULTISPECIES: phosphoribosyltransferase family protein [unclassified Streptomyces]PKW10821.1 putative phosphoribosyltransferase [Streptomyces sp. 5112.2]SEB95693.1 Predicted phosphoribosyltransferase [Streptomyces sp. 1222.5]SED95529.1 Predicted phosphoribosyltransferase [Streptomyces sp. 2231.1]
MRFRDRAEAGRELAGLLADAQARGELTDPVVLALPRGGIAVAEPVARALDAPLDVLVVRKIGAPHHEEFAVGALAGDDPPLFDADTLDQLGLTEKSMAPVVERERRELRRRERRYRGDRPVPELAGRTVIVVDDGLATGATARAALRHLRRRRPARLVLAVPVGAPDSVELLAAEADTILCPHRPTGFSAVGQWYEDFGQLTDDEVLAALAAH